MNPLFLVLGAGAALYALTRSSSTASSTPKRAPITYQMIRAEDWVPIGSTPKPTPANEFVIVGKYTRGMFQARIRATKLPDGYYVIDEVLYNKSPGALDILPGLDHGWLWVPKRDEFGNYVVNDKNEEIWVESVVPMATV